MIPGPGSTPTRGGNDPPYATLLGWGGEGRVNVRVDDALAAVWRPLAWKTR